MHSSASYGVAETTAQSAGYRPITPEGGTAEILDVIPLKKPNRVPVTGIPNPCVPHEEPLVNIYGEDISDLRDSDALDPEGLTVDRAGNF